MDTIELIYLLQQMLKIDIKNMVEVDGSCLKVFLSNKHLKIAIKKQN